MKIAICDDDQILCHHLEEMLLELGRKEQTVLQTELFFDGDTLWNYLKQGYRFDLLFLDIEMDDTNGFDAAEELMSGSSQPLIVFVTKSTEYTIRGYDVAFHYLVKPLNEEKFYEVLKRALRLIIPQYFSFSSNGELYRIPVQEILYFESRNYMLFIHTQQQIYKTR